jgi:thioredoxin-dependent peroxiredoxin
MPPRAKKPSACPVEKGRLTVGSKAPAFVLHNEAGQLVSLHDLRGKWLVLYFYPKDDTPGCTKEACEFTTALSGFQSLGAVVLGVSPDSPESHAKFRKKHALKISLLSDPTHEMLDEYAAWGEKSMYGRKYQGVLRSTVLIDPKGKIAFHWPSVKPVGHAAEVRAKLAELTG